jgi:GT2 family glycosyltransferase
VRFDDQLVFGYDEVDIATQAVAHGYTIVQCDAAANWHYPSPVNRDYYRPHTEASRLYVTFKRYALHERAYAKAAAFALLAPLHCLGAALKRGEAAAVADAWRTVAAAGRHWRTARKSGRAAGAAQTRSSTA